jgi:nucleoside-diphosphate-sugar epimerase
MVERLKAMPHLFCFGLGYSARAFAKRLSSRGWTISGTNRNGEPGAADSQLWHFGGTAAIASEAFDGITHLLISIPPDERGDVVLRFHLKELAHRRAQFFWVGYLSTTGVYGDRAGGWVDEDSTLAPDTDRGRRRREAENAWLKLFVEQGLPVHLFRLAGIYGPGRNSLVSLRDGTAHRIIKPGQVFSRIHVDDIAGALEASAARPHPGRIYNICDDEPSPPQDVIAYAARLLGRAPPPEMPFDEADLSPMAKSFYTDSKRVSNKRIKEELGYRLLYPTYREGLRALLSQEKEAVHLNTL